MKVGDLLQDVEYGDIGLLVKIDRWRERGKPHPRTHLVLNCDYDNLHWLEEQYLLQECEVISESR